MKEKIASNPVVWGCLIFIAGAALASYTGNRVIAYLTANPQLTLPEVRTQTPVIYFFIAVIVVGLILFLIPIARLKLVFRILFSVLWAWGLFVTLVLALPSAITAVVIAIAGGLFWFISPRVWLHNLLLLIALASVGAVFGTMLSPWQIMILLGVVSVYDVVAVRFGYMMWMAKKLSDTDSLPAFIIHKSGSGWNLNLKHKDARKMIAGEAGEREFSILGGGDIGFPLILMVSVLDESGFAGSLIVAAFALAGLIGAYAIQRLFLKGKPMPALPPIALASLMGLLVVKFVMSQA
ncbi:MAG: presenilin family intramembrane aspartyl protease [Dehalococcoidia bacterium]|nr:presenilin family intramembrane aspartyl protease [Dehalococcoidia bacterium]